MRWTAFRKGYIHLFGLSVVKVAVTDSGYKENPPTTSREYEHDMVYRCSHRGQYFIPGVCAFTESHDSGGSNDIQFSLRGHKCSEITKTELHQDSKPLVFSRQI